jgi:hypothetical protein
MTYKEIKLNRILDKETVQNIKEWWLSVHYDDSDDPDEREELTYISDEKVQRLPLEEVAYILFDGKGINSLDEAMHIFMKATGRSYDDLYTAIFGEGSDDDVEYEPTRMEKLVIELNFALAIEMKKDKSVKREDFNSWPKYLKDLWIKMLKEHPDYTLKEAREESLKYLKRYEKIGYPKWLNDWLRENTQNTL